MWHGVVVVLMDAINLYRVADILFKALATRVQSFEKGLRLTDCCRRRTFNISINIPYMGDALLFYTFNDTNFLNYVYNPDTVKIIIRLN